MNERGVIGSFLFKLVFFLLILGVGVFEVGAVVVSRVQIDRATIEAASEAGLEYGRTHSSAKAAAEARRVLAISQAELVKFSVDLKGDRVHVTARKTATTLFIHRIGPLKRYVVANSTHDGRIR